MMFKRKFLGAGALLAAASLIGLYTCKRDDKILPEPVRENASTGISEVIRESKHEENSSDVVREAITAKRERAGDVYALVGKVLEDARPLAEVTIKAKVAQEETPLHRNLVTTTEQDGSFSVPVPTFGPYTLTAIHGKKIRTVRTTPNKEQIILFEDSPDVLVQTVNSGIKNILLKNAQGQELEGIMQGGSLARFEDLEAGPYSVAIESQEGGYITDQICIFDQDVQKNYVIPLPQSFRGRVRDKETKQGIEDALLTVTIPSIPMEWFTRRWKSDEAGTIQGENMQLTAQEHFVKISAPGYILAATTMHPNGQDQQFELRKGLTLQGIIIDEGGQPIPNAFVHLLHAATGNRLENRRPTRSNEEGKFVYKGIEALRESDNQPRRYSVAVTHKRYHQQTLEEVIGSTEQPFITIRMERNAGTLEGNVVDEQNTPTEAIICLSLKHLPEQQSRAENSPFAVREITTTENGSFNFGGERKLRPGVYTITALPKERGFIKTAYDVAIEEEERITLTVDKEVVVQGRTMMNNTPIANADVTFIPMMQNTSAIYTTSNEEGIFEARFPNQATQIFFVGKQNFHHVRGTINREEQNSFDINFPPITNTALVRVIDANTKTAIPHYNISCTRGQGIGSVNIFNREGQASVPSDATNMSISAPGYNPSRFEMRNTREKIIELHPKQ